MVLCMWDIQDKEKLWILIKNEINNKLNSKVLVSVYGMRNRVNRLEGILYKTYPNLFTVLVDGEEKSFCYRDVITGDVKINYL